MKKILITGGSGQVAFDLKRLAIQQKILFYAPSKLELDISNFGAVNEAIRQFTPDVVINTAAYTSVDQAEREREKALSANFYGAKNLAIACEAFACPLVQLSTDYVFNGESHRPYNETDLVSPINMYGESKCIAEKFISEYCEKYIILRVSAVFGVHGNNFVKTIIRLAREKKMLRIVSDQITCPTPSLAIAETLLTLCHASEWGVYHYCGHEAVSWYEFAKTIINTVEPFEALCVTQVDPISTAEYPTSAKRPAYSVLNCNKMNKHFTIDQPDWRVGLQHVIQEIYAT